MFAAGLEQISRADMVNEIFDLVNPEIKHVITLKDLSNCGVGAIVMNMLIDFTAFHDYDSRPNPNPNELKEMN